MPYVTPDSIYLPHYTFQLPQQSEGLAWSSLHAHRVITSLLLSSIIFHLEQKNSEDEGRRRMNVNRQERP